MRKNRFFGDFDFGQKSLQILSRDFLHQTKNVLRLKIGEEVFLVNGQGEEALVKIKKYSNDFAEVEIIQIGKNQLEPERKIVLYCSLLKRENFELAVQKVTEVGVSEIVPIICERTVKTGFKKERLEKIIKEAAEQSGRGILPLVRETVNFGVAIAEAKANDVNILFDVLGTKASLSDILKLARQGKRIGIFIGPEGGWGDFELDLARQRKIEIMNLGKLTLRAETAAIVATYLTCRA